MTTAKERTQALISAGDLLRELSSLIGDYDISQDFKAEAQQILRHFPSNYEIQRIAEQTERDSAFPMLSSR